MGQGCAVNRTDLQPAAHVLVYTAARFAFQPGRHRQVPAPADRTQIQPRFLLFV